MTSPYPPVRSHTRGQNAVLPDEITLHIGLQKTGTTLIQRSLRRLRPQLAAQGVAYLDRPDVKTLSALQGWRAFRDVTEPVPDLSPEMPAFVLARPDLASQFTDQLREIATDRCDEASTEVGQAPRHLLMSNESLVGTQAPDFGPVYRPRAVAALEHVLDALRPERVNLVLYVRRQDRLIESQYVQRIHAGEYHEFADWAARATAQPMIDFPGLVDRLEGVDRVNDVRVRPFEIISAGSKRFIGDLLHPLAPDLDLSSVIKQPANPSYTAPALEAALVLNPLLETPDQLRTVRQFLRKTFPPKRYPVPDLFSSAQRAEVVAMYSAANRELFARYMPEFPVDSYASDEATAAIAGHL